MASWRIATKQSAELLAMPREILEYIFIHLDNIDLLTTSHVCKAFVSIAADAFARKYSQCHYIVGGIFHQRYGFHKVMLTKYGERLSDITIMRVPREDECILDLAEKKCCNLKKVTLIKVTKLINLKGLKIIRLSNISNMTKEQLTAFLDNSPQVEELSIGDNLIDLVEILHNRSSLKSLEIGDNIGITISLPQIKVDSLKILSLYLTKTDDYMNVLRVLDCKRLEELTLNCSEADDDLITTICSFKMITSLCIENCLLAIEQIIQLANGLKHLSRLIISGNESDAKCNIFSVLTIFPALTKLTVYLDDFEQFLQTFKIQPISEFHSRFANGIGNAEVEIINHFEYPMMSTSKDRTYMYSGNSIELHWMNNFNEKEVQKLLNKLNHWQQYDHLKFINHCSDHTSDISTLSPRIDHTDCLEIKSNGPITVNAIVSVNSTFFFPFYFYIHFDKKIKKKQYFLYIQASGRRGMLRTFFSLSEEA